MSFKSLKNMSTRPTCPNAPRKLTKMFKRETTPIPKFSLSDMGDDSGESAVEWLNADDSTCPDAPIKTGKYDFSQEYPISPFKQPRSISYMPSRESGITKPHITYEY